ncbi:hypothetical protein HYV12_02295 [Candidatus Dojkabacteria bacterium]|nr:hypothetical protein [Candidatus Dojkabacteria bacterium]
MKKLLISLFILFILFSSATPPLYAQDPVTTGDYFDVELSTETQSAWSKSVPIIIKFRSNITAKKVEISWDTPKGVEVRERHPQFISVTKGEVYTYKASLKPSAQGTYTISGNITNWEVDTNYTSSDELTLSFDEELVTIPETPGYSGAVLVKGAIVVLLWLGGFTGLFFLGKYAFKRLTEWLKPPE